MRGALSSRVERPAYVALGSPIIVNARTHSRVAKIVPTQRSERVVTVTITAPASARVLVGIIVANTKQVQNARTGRPGA